MTQQDTKISALQTWVAGKITEAQSEWDQALVLSEGPFGWMPEVAAILGAVYEKTTNLRNVRGMLINYKQAVDNWAINDAVYAELHLPQPPMPAPPEQLLASLANAGAPDVALGA